LKEMARLSMSIVAGNVPGLPAAAFATGTLDAPADVLDAPDALVPVDGLATSGASGALDVQAATNAMPAPRQI